MFISLPKWLLRIILSSFLLWIVLSTVVPQLLTKHDGESTVNIDSKEIGYKYKSLIVPKTSSIKESNVYFIIGHPDDEVMFFAPSVIEISKKKHRNNVNLICFSKGAAVNEDMGRIRTNELYESVRILGIERKNTIVLDSFKDGMNETWDENEIAETLRKYVHIDTEKPLVLITFDENGVSGHPNHISLYHGTKRFFKRNFKKGSKHSKLYVLKSLNFLEKYSSTFLTNAELFVDHLSSLVIKNILKININISFFNKKVKASSIRYYSDLNMLSVSYAAMSYGHFSQMVWFRYGWLLLSRYLNFNHLIQEF